MQKILVKGLNWVGDAVMSSAFFKSLKKGNPETEIYVAARPWVAEVYKNNPYIDNVIELDDKKNKFGFVKELRKYKFDKGILLPKSLSSALLFRLAGIKNLSGFNTQHRGFLLKNKIELKEEYKKKHQVYLHLEIAYRNNGVKLENPELIFETDKTADKSVEKWFDTKKKYFGISPGAAFGPAKQWFPERFANIADYVFEKYGLIPVLFGAKNEISISKKIVDTMKTGNCLNLTGKTGLQEFFSGIKKCKLFLSNDSGPMHLAAGLKIPQIAIFGSTNSVTTGPFSDNAVVVNSNIECSPCIKRTCKFGTYECMKQITVEKVKNVIDVMIMKYCEL